MLSRRSLDHIAAFARAYEAHLRASIAADPHVYGCTPDDAPAIVTRMLDTMRSGRGYLTNDIRTVARQLGVTVTITPNK